MILMDRDWTQIMSANSNGDNSGGDVVMLMAVIMSTLLNVFRPVIMPTM